MDYQFSGLFIHVFFWLVVPPLLIAEDFGNAGLRYSKGCPDGFLWCCSFEPSDFNYLIKCQFRKVGTFSVGLQIQICRMELIFLSGDPLQIASGIIILITVFVVHFGALYFRCPIERSAD